MYLEVSDKIFDEARRAKYRPLREMEISVLKPYPNGKYSIPAEELNFKFI